MEPDWIGSLCGRLTVSQSSYGVVKQNMVKWTSKMTILSPERRRWRLNKVHTVGLVSSVVLLHARSACAQPQTVDEPEPDTKWTQPHCALQLEMIRTHAVTSPTDLRQDCVFVPAILYALRMISEPIQNSSMLMDFPTYIFHDRGRLHGARTPFTFINLHSL